MSLQTPLGPSCLHINIHVYTALCSEDHRQCLKLRGVNLWWRPMTTCVKLGRPLLRSSSSHKMFCNNTYLGCLQTSWHHKGVALFHFLVVGTRQNITENGMKTACLPNKGLAIWIRKNPLHNMKIASVALGKLKPKTKNSINIHWQTFPNIDKGKNCNAEKQG